MAILTPTEEKVMDYLLRRTTPVAAETIVKHFIISRSNASLTLKRLQERGLLDLVKIGNKKFFKIKE